VPTPHEEGYDGRNPTSDRPVKDFNYDPVKSVLILIEWKICQGNDAQIIVLISTVLPGTIRKELNHLYLKNKIVYNPYLIAMGTVEQDFLQSRNDYDWNQQWMLSGDWMCGNKTTHYQIFINKYVIIILELKPAPGKK
jgi:hypothetical protein